MKDILELDLFKEITEHIAVMDADDGTLVALVGPNDERYGPENLSETRKYAALFAAAPDLLYALECLAGCPGLTALRGYREELDEAMITARAAIKKARQTP